ncbi:hypothetical protein [Pseudomonas sp.]|jgi:hypothetical protein|uniref:hypothetical protein n=1 Tax=Pseudomonas sp. TaxID=306 RepID=UPI0039C98FC1
MGAAGVGSVVMFVHGRDRGLTGCLRSVIVIVIVIVSGMVVLGVRLFGVVMRVVNSVMRGRSVYRVTHRLSL